MLRHLSAVTALLQRMLCDMLGRIWVEIKTYLSYNTLQRILCNIYAWSDPRTY